MILNRSKLASITLAVVFEIILMIPFLYALKKEFYFYQAVIIGLLILPFVLTALLQNTRKTLLVLLIISVSINPKLPIYRSYLLAYPISIDLCLSDIILLSCWIYIIAKKINSPSEYFGIHQKYSNVFLSFYILWIAFGVFTLPFAVDKVIAIPELIGMMRILFLYLAVPFLITKKSDLRFIAILLAVSVLLQAILIIFQYRYEDLLIRIPGGSQEFDIVAAGTLFRPAGTLGHSSHYAILSVLILPVTLVLMQYSTAAKKFFFGLMLVLLFIALIITASRAGLGMGIMGLSAILFLSRKTKIGKKLLLQSIAILIMIFTAGWFVAGERLVDRITYDYNSAYLRIPMTKTALEVIKHHPFGVGLNNYTLVAPGYDYYDIFSYFPFPVHNIYLLNFAELGLLGGSCLIGLLVTIVYLTFKYAEKIKEEEENKILLQSIGIGITCSWLIGLLGWSQRSSNIHLLYFAILAAGITSYSVPKTRHQAKLNE